MSDMIRLEDAVEEIYNSARDNFTDKDTFQIFLDALKDVDKRIRNLPAVDAVEVVRCRECRHYKPSRFNASTTHYCGVIDGFPKEHWFCADGQRREDGDV